MKIYTKSLMLGLKKCKISKVKSLPILNTFRLISDKTRLIIISTDLVNPKIEIVEAMAEFEPIDCLVTMKRWVEVRHSLTVDNTNPNYYPRVTRSDYPFLELIEFLNECKEEWIELKQYNQLGLYVNYSFGRTYFKTLFSPEDYPDVNLILKEKGINFVYGN